MPIITHIKRQNDEITYFYYWLVVKIGTLEQVVSLLWNMIFFFNKVPEDLVKAIKKMWEDLKFYFLLLFLLFLLLHFDKQVLKIFNLLPSLSTADTRKDWRKIKWEGKRPYLFLKSGVKEKNKNILTIFHKNFFLDFVTFCHLTLQHENQLPFYPIYYIKA